MTKLSRLLLALCAAAPLAALAHNGKLDKHGCHKDRNKGGYHCHSGALKGESFASDMEMLKELHRRERQSATRR